MRESLESKRESYNARIRSLQIAAKLKQKRAQIVEQVEQNQRVELLEKEAACLLEQCWNGQLSTERLNPVLRDMRKLSREQLANPILLRFLIQSISTLL